MTPNDIVQLETPKHTLASFVQFNVGRCNAGVIAAIRERNWKRLIKQMPYLPPFALMCRVGTKSIHAFWPLDRKCKGKRRVYSTTSVFPDLDLLPQSNSDRLSMEYFSRKKLLALCKSACDRGGLDSKVTAKFEEDFKKIVEPFVNKWVVYSHLYCKKIRTWRDFTRSVIAVETGENAGGNRPSTKPGSWTIAKDIRFHCYPKFGQAPDREKMICDLVSLEQYLSE